MLVFPVTYLLFPVCVWMFLLALDRRNEYPVLEFLLYSFGLAPALVALILYYALLLFPGCDGTRYVLATCAIFGLLGMIGILPARRRFAMAWFATGEHIHGLSAWQKAEWAAFWIILVLPLTWFAWHYLNYALWYSLNGHDVLEYACYGKFFFNERTIYPFFETTYPGVGIVFAAKHAPSFSLLLTWERFFTAVVRPVESDLFFRTAVTWYGLLILAIQCFWISKLNRWLAVIGIAAMLGNSWFFATIVTAHHLDTFRIFLLMLSWIWLARHIYRDDRLSLYLFGACTGLAAFAHSIGMLLAAFSLVTLVLFSRGGIRVRFYKGVVAALLTLLFGGGHYVIDLIWGRQWVAGL